jgi:hypothetical protein
VHDASTGQALLCGLKMKSHNQRSCDTQSLLRKQVNRQKRSIWNGKILGAADDARASGVGARHCIAKSGNQGKIVTSRLIPDFWKNVCPCLLCSAGRCSTPPFQTLALAVFGESIIVVFCVVPSAIAFKLQWRQQLLPLRLSSSFPPLTFANLPPVSAVRLQLRFNRHSLKQRLTSGMRLSLHVFISIH